MKKTVLTELMPGGKTKEFRFLLIAAGVFVLLIIISAIFHVSKPSGLASGHYIIAQRGPSFSYQASILDTVTFGEIFWLIILGFVSGLIGGMLGMGGGLLKVSGMYLFFGYEVILARVITLITYSCISVSAFLKYRQYNFIMWDVVKILAPTAIAGVIAGVLLGNIMNGAWIEKLLGVYAIGVAGIMVFQIYKEGKEDAKGWTMNKTAVKELSFIGVLKGFFCGLFGISGGIISVPLQQLMVKIPMKNAIANSLASAMFSATFAAFLALTTGIMSGFFKFSIPFFLTLPLIPGTIIGARIGARFTKQMNTDLLKILFSIITFVMGVRILFFTV